LGECHSPLPKLVLTTVATAIKWIGSHPKKLKAMEIKIDRQPSPEQLKNLGISNWSIWTKEVSEFPWTYDMTEICYFLEGNVVVIPEGGQPVEMGKGDLVTFPAGMSCQWKIRRDVKKYYNFS
jgi:uncharacterized protein